MHNPSNNNCPRNADPRNESCACNMTFPRREMLRENLRRLIAESRAEWEAETNALARRYLVTYIADLERALERLESLGDMPVVGS